MQRYVIETEEGKKSRSFGAMCLGIITADVLMPDNTGKSTTRPVWALFGGSETELKPFMANLRLGRKAKLDKGYTSRGGERLEILKSSQFQMHWQKEPEGAMVTIHHSELFKLDPGMTDPVDIRFILLVPEDWAEAQTSDLDLQAVDYVMGLREFEDRQYSLTQEKLEALLPTAYLFAAYVDRRTHMPLITDGRFYLQLLCSALHKKLASFPRNNFGAYGYDDWGFNKNHGFAAVGGKDHADFNLTSVGIRHLICFHATQLEFEEFLREEVRTFFAVTEPVDDFRPISQFLEAYFQLSA